MCTSIQEKIKIKPPDVENKGRRKMTKFPYCLQPIDMSLKQAEGLCLDVDTLFKGERRS